MRVLALWNGGWKGIWSLGWVTFYDINAFAGVATSIAVDEWK